MIENSSTFMPKKHSNALSPVTSDLAHLSFANE